MFGTGGKYVEYLDDTVIRSAYLTDDDIDSLINSTKIGKIIKGVRGEKPVDIKKIKNAIKSVAQMMLDNPEITECDLNPLLIGENNEVFAVDVRIKLLNHLYSLRGNQKPEISHAKINFHNSFNLPRLKGSPIAINLFPSSTIVSPLGL